MVSPFKDKQFNVTNHLRVFMGKQGILGKLKEQEREVRQKIIIDAARTVFEEKTYDSVSMAEIAKVAGMAKSSIYTYFTSQEALYVEIAYRDSGQFIDELQMTLAKKKGDAIHTAIHHFLDHYIAHRAKWKMITHFALHGKTDSDSLDKLNEISRRLMDLFESIVNASGYQGNSRLLAHTLFSSLSGILIAFRNYPGRTEDERITHMKRIGAVVEEMVSALVEKENLK